MARTSNTKSVVDEAIVEESAVAQTSEADKNMNEENEIVEKKTTAKKVVPVIPLEKDDEIEVISLIPNVSYKDSHTGDMYVWEEAGQIEPMSFDVVQRMWQKHKTYFKGMWLKPLDERVIKKFALSGMYEKYDFLMDESNYTQENISKICDSISSTPNALKLSLCNKVKSFVASGKVSDVMVIKAMEQNLKIDLFTLIR